MFEAWRWKNKLGKGKGPKKDISKLIIGVVHSLSFSFGVA